MRGLLKGGVAAAIGLLLTPPALPAQSAEFSLGGGLSIPLGTFDDLVKTGWHGTAAVGLRARGAPLGIQVDGSFSEFSDETPLDLKSQLIYGTANAVYRFESSVGSRFRPYLIGGLGVYNSKATGGDALEGSSTEAGINAGAGFDFEVGGAALLIESRFHSVFTEGDNITFVPITVGIRFGGG